MPHPGAHTNRPGNRRRTRRAAAAVASAMSVALLAAACGSGGGSGSSSGGAAPSASAPVTITFWSWLKGTQDVVNAFNASHPDVHVDFESIPSGVAGGYAKISNAIKAGNAPDIYNVEYAALPDFVSQGGVQDISKLVGNDVRSQYLPQTLQMTTLDGSLYALPLDASPQVLYYRKDLFAQAGITTPPATWGEYQADAAKLKQAEPDTRMGTFFPDDPSTLEALSWQNGAQWFSTSGDTWHVAIDSPQTRQVSDYWQQLVSNDLVRTQTSFSQQWISSLVNGQTASYLGASWGAGVLKADIPQTSGKWAAAPAPTWDGNPASGMLGGTTFAVSKDTKKAKAALEFAEWATGTPQGVQARIASGTSSILPADPALVPGAKAAFTTDFYGGQDLYSLFVDASKTIRPGWTWGPSMGVTNNAMADTFSKGGSVPSGVTAAQSATVADMKNRGLKVSP